MVNSPTPKTYTWRFLRPNQVWRRFFKNVLSSWIGQNENQNEDRTRSEQPYRRGVVVMVFYGVLWYNKTGEHQPKGWNQNEVTNENLEH